MRTERTCKLDEVRECGSSSTVGSSMTLLETDVEDPRGVDVNIVFSIRAPPAVI